MLYFINALSSFRHRKGVLEWIKGQKAENTAKGLQKLPGRAGIRIAMGRYAHGRDGALSKAVLQFEQDQKIQNGAAMVRQRPLRIAKTIENKEKTKENEHI